MEKQKQTYPIIMKNSKQGLVEIIYRNRVEIYTLENTDTFSDEEGKVLDAEAEVEMCNGSGFKRVHDSDNDKHWKIWDASKEVEK